MRIAVDVMGGDHAPDSILKGCLLALADLEPDDRLLLVGPEPLIRDFLDERGVTDPRVVIEHAPDVISMDDSPAKAVRGKPNSSIVRMSWLGAERSGPMADVVLSAGNTGACVSAAIMQMKRLPHVIRPGIAVTVPSFHGPVVMIDAGANPEPKPSHLAQYALMGETLARQLLKIEYPRVGVMNIGSEEAKGTDLIRETRDLITALPGINYVGYVEGRDFFEGVADVVVTDGLVGNTVLKAAEGLAKSMFKAIIAELMEMDVSLITPMEEVITRIYKKNDYHEHGGAPLLGVRGACFIAHGSSEARTIRAAIRNCRDFVKAGVNEAIVQRLAEVPALAGAAPGAE
ncbi:MAG: phosphate acyltransferase PlsX [Phycisphaeraceae bacterium]|nr:MAG: phosphate acyltransferase PlsX [Phycisphaeraceae bacterium]